MQSRHVQNDVIPIPRRVPEGYLRAEISAFPLTSDESFRTCLLDLDPQLEPGGATRDIWRACETLLAPHTGWSLDRLVAARDHGWFGLSQERRKVRIHDYLTSLATSFLEPRAGITQLKGVVGSSLLESASQYRWLTLAIPDDLLLAAVGVDPAPRRIESDPPLLIRRLLDSGVAEIHQHVGAGMDFQLLWVSAMAALATPDIEESDLASPGAPLTDGRHLIRWMTCAAIARCALAEFLIRNPAEGFLEFLAKVVDPPSTLGKGKSSWTPLRRKTLFDAITALVSAEDSRLPSFSALRDLYADLHPRALARADVPILNVEDAYRHCDPIAVRLDLVGENVGERWLMRHGLAYLKRPSPHKFDTFFARVFWQVIRIRCTYYRTVVQRPMTGGLHWFIRFYSRLGKLRNPIGRILPQASYETAGQRLPIKALEARTSPGNTAVELASDLLDYLRSWQRVLNRHGSVGADPEFGMIYHFTKERDPNRHWSEGTPQAFGNASHADPQMTLKKDSHGRFSSFYAKLCPQARAMASLIAAEPSTLFVIRGLDVASDELAVPTWVLVPLFRYVMLEAARVSILVNAPPLRITGHVGEDFRHLQEGMRRIYEFAHYILDGGSGRIGHGIALGVDPRQWAESVGTVLLPAEERMWDLVWEWRLYTRYKIRPEYAAVAPDGRIHVLLNQLLDLTAMIFPGRTIAIECLAEAHHLLHCFAVPPFVSAPPVDGGANAFLNAAKNLPKSRLPANEGELDVNELLELYLDSESVYRRGQKLVEIPLNHDEVLAMDALQLGLRRGIARNGIVIEVNPSSNLLIGDLLDLRNHPILRLFPPAPTEGGPPPVAIALGSDDPVTFNTRLVREYTLLHETARAAGYPERVVQEWLELIRRTGMDARFTLCLTRSKIEQIMSHLARFLHLPFQ